MLDRFRKSRASRTVEPARFDMGPVRAANAHDANHPAWLALAALIVIGLPYLPFGQYALYPFFILTTWFHEMGHSLTAILMGMHFDRLVIMSNGSGYALIASDPDSWNITQAAVSAGGPLGPAIAGALMILASAHAKWRIFALYALGGILLASTAIWVRSIVGWAVLIPTAAVIIAIAARANDEIARFALQFLGVHAAISMFGQWGYLFSSGAVVDGAHQTSDTGAMARALLLPYWFWASLLIAIGAGIVGVSLWHVLVRNERRRATPRKTRL
ncbi:MAG: M50 family metallopeptidase [Pontixanthobacter sp.]